MRESVENRNNDGEESKGLILNQVNLPCNLKNSIILLLFRNLRRNSANETRVVPNPGSRLTVEIFVEVLSI